MMFARVLLRLLCLWYCLFVDSAARADLWWDTNGATAGSSSGNTAPGSFDGMNWTTDSAGVSATQSWVPGETAVFSAGTNANSNPPIFQSDGYAVTVAASSIQVAGIKVEEGYPYLNGFGKTLSFTNGALAIDVAANAKLHVNMLYGPTSGVITKTGDGDFISEQDQTSFAGKWVVNGGVLYGDDNELGVTPANVVPDLITLNSGAGIFGYDSSGKRGITLGAGGGGFTLPDTGLGGFPPSMGWAGPITGTGPFVIQVHGFAYWGNSNNNYTGDTIIKDGIVTLEAANAIPATSDVKIIGATTTDTAGFNQTIKSLSMVAGSYLNISSTGGRSQVYSTITLQNPAGETIAGKIDGGGTLAKNGAGAVTLSGDNGSYSFVLNSGTVGVGHDHAFGSGTGAVTVNGGTIANTAATDRALASGININGDFTVDASMNATPGKLKFGGVATFNATHTVTVGSNTNLALTDLKQSVAGIGFTKSGPGTLEIWKTSSGNSNPLTGPTTVLDGSIRLLNGATLGSGTNSLILAGGAFDVATSSQALNNPLNVTADSSITTSGPYSLTLVSNSISGTGKLTVRNDSATVGSTFGVTFMGNGASFAPGPIEIANGTFGSTVLISNNGFQFSETFANTISGTGRFQVVGSYFPAPNTGATTLLAANTFSGGTTLNGGLLLVNNTSGSGTGTGPVSVAAAGRLGGTGTIAGAVTNSGTIAPGASVGTLTMSSDVTMSANSHLAIELSGAAADQLVVGGNLDLSSNDYLDVTGTGTGPWVIATCAGTRSGTFDSVTSGYLVDYTTPGQIVLNTIALPGDYSGDGIVDATDFIVWRKTPEAYSGAAGYNSWRANFGKTLGAGNGAASAVGVPEPTGMPLLGLASALYCGNWGRGRRRG